MCSTDLFLILKLLLRRGSLIQIVCKHYDQCGTQ